MEAGDSRREVGGTIPDTMLAVTTRINPALGWAAIRVILRFH